MTSGQAGESIRLFDRESINRVPLNLPHTTFVWNGAVDSEGRQLLLATSTQEILAVDLDAHPLTVTSVAALPAGWQFAVSQPFLYHAAEETVYVQVKQNDTPTANGAEEIWVYDTDTWTQTSRLNLREQLDNIPDNLAADDSTASVNLTNYGLALSADGRDVYSLSRQGFLRLERDTEGRLNGAWLNMEGIDMDFAGIFAIP